MQHIATNVAVCVEFLPLYNLNIILRTKLSYVLIPVLKNYDSGIVNMVH